ncbi:mitochondrial carrier domain-containing protein, partial [Chytriomyces sp. MP71]
TTTVHLLATLSASTACTVGTSPLWVVRTRLMLVNQAQHAEPHGYKYRSTSHAIRNMTKREGFMALYKGLGPSLLGVGHSLIHFPLYEHLKATIKERKIGLNPDGTLTNTSILLCSSAAKFVASIATYPHEVIRTRLQTQKTFLVDASPDMGFGVPEPKYRGVLQTVRVLVREEGWMSMYRGLTTSIIRQVPAGAISLWIYELVLKW